MFPILSAESELARLDSHFARVLGRLHARPPRGLSRVQRARRATHLKRLEAYRERGLFPQNRRFAGRRVPHFIDEGGTRCAMAHLIEAAGQRDLVRHVARTRNYARIVELAGIAELVAWLEDNGLTLDEAARIQPEYCVLPGSCVCGVAFSSGMLQGTLGNGGSSLSVTAIYGPATGVAIGDVVPAFDLYAIAGPTDIAFASWDPPQGASIQFVASASGAGPSWVTVTTAACGGVTELQSTPGPLPLQVVEQALSQPSFQACVDELAKYDPAWGKTVCGPDYWDAGAGGSAGVSGAGGSAGTSSGGGDAGPRDAGAESSADSSADSSGGCGMAPHDAFNGEWLLLMTAALGVYGARRKSRLRAFKK